MIVPASVILIAPFVPEYTPLLLVPKALMFTCPLDIFTFLPVVGEYTPLL